MKELMKILTKQWPGWEVRISQGGDFMVYQHGIFRHLEIEFDGYIYA